MKAVKINQLPVNFGKAYTYKSMAKKAKAQGYKPVFVTERYWQNEDEGCGSCVVERWVKA